MVMQNMVEGFAFCEGEAGAITELALIRKNRPDWMAGSFNGIGGRVEEGETPSEAITREFREETGVEVPTNAWGNFLNLTGCFGVVHFFRTFMKRRTFQEIRTVTDEEVKIFTMRTLPTNMISNLNWIIPLAFDSNLIIPVLISENFHKEREWK